MHVRRSVMAVLAASALTGCDSQDPESDGADQTAPPGSASTSAPTATPFRPVPSARAVVRRLTDLDSGRTIARVEIDGYVIERTATYRLSDALSEVVTTIDAGADGTLVTKTLSVDGLMMLQLDSASMPMDQCWLRNEAQGVDLAPEVMTLLELEDQDGRTTTDLYTAASMVSAELIDNLGLTPTTTARTEIDLQVDASGDVTGWSTTIARLAASAKEAGLDPVAAALTLTDSEIDVTLEGLGEPDDLSAPAPSRQVPFDPTTVDPDDPAYVADVAACEAR